MTPPDLPAPPIPPAPPMDLLHTDATNRKRAIDPTQSFLIEAPAGAGKTELLTQRFLALLARVDDPEEIVALTFTNKAAAEMRHRVVSSLTLAATGQEPPEDHKKETYRLARTVLQRDQDRQWGLLEHAGRLRMTTLDALCGQLARQMPLLSRLGAQPGIATDATPHYQRAAQDTLDLLEGQDGPADAVARVLAHFDNDAGRLQALLVAMLASRDQWLRHTRKGVQLAPADETEQALELLVQQELHTLAATLPLGWQTELMPVARFVATQALLADAEGRPHPDLAHLGALERWTQPLPTDASALPLWRGVAQLLLTKTGNVRSQLPAAWRLNTPEGKPLHTAFKALLQRLKDAQAEKALVRLRHLPNPTYSADEAQLVQDLLTVLQQAAAQLWLSFKHEGEVDFTAMAQNALLALGDEDAPSDLQLRLDYRLSHLLVDEFQDTSPTQVELLCRLTAGWQPSDGRTLFLVGDPMQSIYRFRKADVGLFLKVQQDQRLGTVGLQPLRLYRNNRSYAEVVDWVNGMFPAVFAPQNDPYRGAVCFAPAQATRPADPQAQVVWHPIIDAQASESGGGDADGPDNPLDHPIHSPTNGASGSGPGGTDEDGSGEGAAGGTSSAAQREAETVLQLVRQAQADDPTGTVAILVRARPHLAALVRLLRTQQPAVPYQAVEIESLAQRQVIQDLLSLTHALLHQADRTHWLAVLRAPWCGLLLADLHTLAADQHHATLWTLMNEPERVARLSPDGQTRLGHVREVLGTALAHQGRARLRRWVEGVWQSLGGPHCLGGPSDLVDAQAYFGVLDRLDQHGQLDLPRLRVEVDKLFAAPDPNATERLQIMTIHKSKGLEFDTVILPGLDRKAPRPDRPLLLWDEVVDSAAGETDERLVVAPLPHGQPAEDSTPNKYDFLHRFEAERGRNETQRLLYVAVTRAKRQLHLVGCAQPGKAADSDSAALKTPAKDSFLALMWHQAESAFLQAAQAQGMGQNTAQGAAQGTADTVHAPPGPPPSLTTSTTPAPLYNHRLVRVRQPGKPAALVPGTALDAPPPTDAPTTPTTAQNGHTAPDSRLSADVGTLVHRYLELVATDGLAAWTPERLHGLQGPMQRWLQQQGHAAAVAPAAAAEVVQHLHTTLASDDGRWVLAPHAEAACELPLTTVTDGEVHLHAIDRTFVAEGVRWIVDYKTTRHTEDEDRLMQSYAEQLARYSGLFPQAPRVCCAVFLTRTGRLVPVALPSTPDTALHPARHAAPHSA